MRLRAKFGDECASSDLKASVQKFVRAMHSNNTKHFFVVIFTITKKQGEIWQTSKVYI